MTDPIPDENPRQEFAAELRRRRERARLSQRGASAKTSMSDGNWRRLEGGKGTTPWSVVEAARAVGWDDIDQALTLAGFDPSEVPEEDRKPPEVKPPWAKWNRLNTNQQEVIAAMIDVMLTPERDVIGSVRQRRKNPDQD